MQETLEKHGQAMQDLSLSQDEIDTLNGALMEVKKQTLDNLKDFRERLLPIETYLYTMIRREQEMEHNLQKVVHELQTRLQSVMIHSENIMLEVNTLKPKQIHEMAHQLLSSAEAMSTIVNNLGDFQQAYSWGVEKIRPLFIEAWRTYNSEATERNIKLRVNFAPVDGKEPEMEISRQHMELAVNNLMHNAIKYSFHGGHSRERFVEIEGAPDGIYYRISISNYGVGIESEEIEKGLIFKDGYQGHLTQGENRTGSGKGLVFVKRVIDRHHGLVKVESIPMGKREDFFGQPHLNKFTIHLPFKQPTLEAGND
jgi:signal transduction histidine kinase